MSLEPIQLLTIWVFPIVFAITVHEAAHAYVANYYGDNTAKMLGRLTLNPIKHIDPIGTVVVPIAMVLIVGVAFGWAKPVPIEWRNLKNVKKNMIFIAFAGPFSNLIMALMWAVVLVLTYDPNIAFTPVSGDFSHKVIQFLIYSSTGGIVINVFLMALNLIPIPPLDGSRMLSGVLPDRMALTYSKIEPYGFFIIVGLIFLDILSKILNPILNMLFSLFAGFTDISMREISNLLYIITGVG